MPRAHISWEDLENKIVEMAQEPLPFREYKPRYTRPRYNEERLEQVTRGPLNAEFYRRPED